MNFLGHIYFSGNDYRLMQDNLFGDFVKGSDLSQYPMEIQKGIQLHREIDTYIDNHPDVRELMHFLYEPLPKIAGIAIDLFFDHLLAKNWESFHSSPLTSYTKAFYQNLSFDTEVYSSEFLFVLKKMKEHDWLSQYAGLEGLKKACEGVSSRISFENELKNAVPVFIENEPYINEIFVKYMKDARIKFNV